MSDETAKTGSEEPLQPPEATSDSAAEKPPETPARKPAPKARAKRHRPVPVLGLAALLLAVGAGALAVFDFTRWQHQAPVNATLSKELADQTSQLTALQGKLRETTAGLEQGVQQLQAEQSTFNTAVEQISAKLGRTTVGWRLAEAEYLLTIANDRLALERDRRTALIALENVDSKLQIIGDPALLPVRQRISAEVTALKAVDEPDIAGMALTLASLANAVGQLPLVDRTPPGEAREQMPQDAGARTWQQVLQGVWEDLKSLVRIRRHEQPIEPLLPPDEEWYLRQNLRLQLEQARLALVGHETALFRQSLAEAGRWLAAYFDPQVAAVSNLAKTLDDLGQVELNPALPDISASLRELREQMRRLDKPAPPAGSGGAAP